MVEYTKPRNQVNELMEIIREKEHEDNYERYSNICFFVVAHYSTLGAFSKE